MVGKHLATVKAEQSSGLQAKQSLGSDQWIFYFLLGHVQTLRLPVSKACIVFICCGFTATSVTDNLDTEISPQLETDC